MDKRAKIGKFLSVQQGSFYVIFYLTDPAAGLLRHPCVASGPRYTRVQHRSTSYCTRVTVGTLVQLTKHVHSATFNQL